ncbi:MAG: FecR family protein [Pseudomonadota bacterium]
MSTLLSATVAHANGFFESVIGDVRAVEGSARPARVARNQRVIPGTTITTAAGARAVIRFDDGHAVVLNENTEFRVNQYNFDSDKPDRDNIALQLLKGAMRSVSGIVGARSRNAFVLLAPQATIGIRGTDFMIALVNPAYLSVLQGSIAATNAAGTATFAAGTTATVASSAALAVSIPASALPASVTSSFGSMGSVAVGAGAVGAAAGGITTAVVTGVAVAAVAAAVVGSDNKSTVSTTGTK